MKLLTPSTGWVSNDNHLYWTTDSGSHWTDITPVPPGVARAGVSIRSTYFLNTQEGWVVISHPQQVVPLTLKALRTRKTLYDIAQTVDGGETWSFLPLNYPALSPDEQAGLTGPGDMFFLDSLHGWLVMGFDGNSDPGRLLVTDDGGRNWIWEHGVGFSGIIRFTSMKDGWFLGGPYKQLFATHDGGKAWEEVKLSPPPQSGAATEATYEGLPVFDGPRHGFTAVFFIGPPGVQPKFVVYSTDDGGKAWRPVKVLGESEESGALTPIPFSIADSLLIISKEGSPNSTTLARVDLGGDLESTTEFSTKGPLQLSFLDETHGLALGRGGSLLGTSDGGRTWRNVTAWHTPHPSPLPPGITVRHPKIEMEVTHHGTSELLSPLAPAAGGSLGSSAHTSIHVGFDISCAPSTQKMQSWWTYSPYYDIGIYLGRVNVGCKNNTNLTSGWVETVTGKAHGSTQGWGLIPIWVGLQAPCYIVNPNHPQNYAVFGQDPNKTPYQQGQDEAVGPNGNSGAAQRASDLGLSKTIIYYDMENYDTSNATCATAVKSFVSGWVSAMKGKGYWAGVYANPAPVHDDIGNVSPAPDDIWITHWDSKATIFDAAAGWDSLWPAGKRSRQYLNDSETYGSVRLGIDRDIEDAPVAGGSGSKTYTYPSGNFHDLYSSGGLYDAAGINDAHQGVDGEVGQIAANGSGGGLIYDNGSTTYVNGCSATYSCQPNDLNNVGHVVGNYGPSALALHAFLYDPKNSVNPYSSVDYPGAPSSDARGINGDDQVVGFYLDAYSIGHGYLDKNGDFSPIDNSTTSTQAYGINGFGQIVGSFEDSHGKELGFVYQDGSVTDEIGCKGAAHTAFQGINNNQLIAGTCDPNGYNEGFVYDLANKKLLVTFSFAGGGSSTATHAWGVDDSGEVTGGFCYVAGGCYPPHGYYVTPSHQ